MCLCIPICKMLILHCGFVGRALKLNKKLHLYLHFFFQLDWIKPKRLIRGHLLAHLRDYGGGRMNSHSIHQQSSTLFWKMTFPIHEQINQFQIKEKSLHIYLCYCWRAVDLIAVVLVSVEYFWLILVSCSKNSFMFLNHTWNSLFWFWVLRVEIRLERER
jgi:hypothetical protein